MQERCHSIANAQKISHCALTGSDEVLNVFWEDIERNRSVLYFLDEK